MKRAIVLAFVALLFAPAVASAQTTGSGGIGLGVNTTTDQPSLGIAVPIDVGTALRLEPGLFFAYTRSTFEDTGEVLNTTQRTTQSDTTAGIRFGIHSFFAQAGAARAFFGGDIAFIWVNEARSVQIEAGGTTNTTESDDTTPGFSVTPVLGGEVAVAGNLFIGLRAGPQFGFLFPETDPDDEDEKALIFAINGMGRLDVTYYF